MLLHLGATNLLFLSRGSRECSQSYQLSNSTISNIRIADNHNLYIICTYSYFPPINISQFKPEKDYYFIGRDIKNKTWKINYRK